MSDKLKPLQCVEMHFVTKSGEKALVTIAASKERIEDWGEFVKDEAENLLNDMGDNAEFSLVHTRKYELGRR